MKTVASRELRNHTAAVLKEVAGGATIAITVHGEVVAELSPPQRRFPRQLLREDLIAWARRRGADPALADEIERIGSGTTDELDDL